MNFKQFAVATALVAGAVSAQAAAVTPGGNLGVLGSDAELFGAIKYSAGSFTDGYSFTLDNLSAVSGSLAPIFYGPFNFTGVTAGGVSAVLANTNTGVSFSFAGLAAGNYTLSIVGDSLTRSGMYIGSVMAQPVPEPHSIAMLLAGLGLMGAVVVRRRKTH